ncbi:ABC transporter permease [Corynebacterium kutscheri]|uniref:ABC transporter permease n=1 Tax=Corynebacterium kutscheri TaxID=35755 RepID=UPI0037C12E69
MIMDREAIGAIIASPEGTRILVAGAAGTPYKQLLSTMAQAMQAQAQGVPANIVVEDIAPLNEGDPQGLGLSLLALPLAFGGMASGVMFSRLTKRRLLDQLLSVTAVAIMGRLCVAGILNAYGTITGEYLAVTVAVAVGIAAISLTVQALESLWGYAGIGLAAVLMIFIANSLSGIATGAQWLPSPWGAIGQAMPIGATGTLIRNISFFDGNAIATPLIVLSCWIIAAVAILWASNFKRSRVIA